MARERGRQVTHMQKRMHRVSLKYPMGLTRSVFVKARGTADAERVALEKNPDAIGIDRSLYPHN